MKAHELKQIKGIFYNEISGNVFFVKEVKSDRVIACPVITNNRNQMVKILRGTVSIPLDVFKQFKLSGEYTIEEINSL